MKIEDLVVLIVGCLFLFFGIVLESIIFTIVGCTFSNLLMLGKIVDILNDIKDKITKEVIKNDR